MSLFHCVRSTTSSSRVAGLVSNVSLPLCPVYYVIVTGRRISFECLSSTVSGLLRHRLGSPDWFRMSLFHCVRSTTSSSRVAGLVSNVSLPLCPVYYVIVTGRRIGFECLSSTVSGLLRHRLGSPDWFRMSLFHCVRSTTSWSRVAGLVSNVSLPLSPVYYVIVTGRRIGFECLSLPLCPVYYVIVSGRRIGFECFSSTVSGLLRHRHRSPDWCRMPLFHCVRSTTSSSRVAGLVSNVSLPLCPVYYVIVTGRRIGFECLSSTVAGLLRHRLGSPDCFRMALFHCVRSTTSSSRVAGLLSNVSLPLCPVYYVIVTGRRIGFEWLSSIVSGLLRHRLGSPDWFRMSLFHCVRSTTSSSRVAGLVSNVSLQLCPVYYVIVTGRRIGFECLSSTVSGLLRHRLGSPDWFRMSLFHCVRSTTSSSRVAGLVSNVSLPLCPVYYVIVSGRRIAFECLSSTVSGILRHRLGSPDCFRMSLLLCPVYYVSHPRCPTLNISITRVCPPGFLSYSRSDFSDPVASA